MGPSPFNPMPNFQISENGVLKLLKNLKIHKAPGPDGIVPRILRDYADQLAEPLSYIFKKSLDSSIVPSDWQQANVVPIFNKGEKYKPSNYRPVSLTCICCKLLEHVVVGNIMTHLETNQISYDWQHGFRAKKSTETQLVTLIHELSKNSDQKKNPDIVVLDFSKAFDKVSHRHLALKLKYYGMEGKILDWINSFLFNRMQRVVLEGSISENVSVKSGVPQGSVLGHVLFLLYINDLPNSFTSKVWLFADDAIVYSEINSILDSQILQQDLDKLTLWEKTWLIEFNSSFTNFTFMGKLPSFTKFAFMRNQHVYMH